MFEIKNGKLINCKSDDEIITLPIDCIEIPQYAFKDCDNLKQINYQGTKEQWLKAIGNRVVFSDKNSKEYLVVCSDGKLFVSIVKK